MWPCVALLLASAPDPAQALAARVEEVAALDSRVRQVALLVVEGRTDEARTAAAGLPTLRTPAIPGDSLRVPGDGKPCQAARCWAQRASWLLSAAGQPDLSAKSFEQAIAAGGRLTSEQRSALLHAYIESGQYDKALSHARDVSPKSAELLKLLEELAAARHPPLEALRRLGAHWIVARVRHALAIGRYSPRDPGERVAKLRLLKERGVLGLSELAQQALVADPALTADDAAQEASKLAATALRRRGFDDAVAYWDLWLRRRPPPPEPSRALLGQGAARRRQGRLDEAVRLLRQAAVLEEPASGEAEWELGHALLARGAGADALTAYLRAREYPFPVCCQGGWPFALYAGLSLDAMGWTREAVEHYLHAVRSAPAGWRVTLAGHLADMYGSAGRLDALETMLGPSQPLTLHDLWSERPRGVDVARGAVELRRLEDNGDWDGLAAMLSALTANETGFDLWQVRTRHWRAAEAARLLARHPAEALPRLRARLVTGPEGQEPIWVFYALGLMDTPEAVALLTAQADRGEEVHVRHRKSIVYALGLTARGRSALAVLAARDQALARLVEHGADFTAWQEVERSQATAEIEAEFPFPPVPAKLDLPLEMPPPLPPPTRRRGVQKPCACLYY